MKMLFFFKTLYWKDFYDKGKRNLEMDYMEEICISSELDYIAFICTKKEALWPEKSF